MTTAPRNAICVLVVIVKCAAKTHVRDKNRAMIVEILSPNNKDEICRPRPELSLDGFKVIRFAEVANNQMVLTAWMALIRRFYLRKYKIHRTARRY